MVWTNDPYSLDKKIVNMMNDNSITDLMISHGLDTYLEVSMTSNVIAAPVAALEQIFPDASLYADQPKPFERNPMGGIIAIAVCSVLLLLGVAAIVALFVANKKKARREAEAARTDAKLGGVEEAISATASAEDGIPVPPTSVIEPEESMPAHRPNN